MDLFCGAGGLTHGLRELGIHVVAGYDLDPACKYAYEHNNAPAVFHEEDIRDVTSTHLEAHYERAEIRALVGCAPCTPFSALRNGQDTTEENEWSLLAEFQRLVRSTDPELVSMENVPQIRTHSIFEEFVDTLEGRGFHVNTTVAECEKYGVPQARRRLVLLASKFGAVSLLPPTHRKGRYRTVKGAIGRLPPIEAGGRAPRDRVHWSGNLTAINKKRVEASKQGGTWRDWPPELVLECHKRESGASYDAVYGRMEWDEPSPPITTKFFNLGSGRFGHPEQHRALSAREAAILQTFPRNYKFAAPHDPVQLTKLGMLIGNAVPPRLGAIVGASLRHHVLSHRPHARFPALPDRWRNYMGRQASKPPATAKA